MRLLVRHPSPKRTHPLSPQPGRQQHGCNCTCIGLTAPANRPPACHASAFTLIELLIVLAIISLLISILVPALSRAREVARRTVCGANMRQTGMAMLQYSNDYDSWLPAKGNPQNPGARPWQLTNEQQKATSAYGPAFAGIVRDVIERRHTRGTGTEEYGAASPQYLPDPKILLCPSDRFNNTPGEPPVDPDVGYPPLLPLQDLWPTEPVRNYAELPRTQGQLAQRRKTYTSYVYVALLRSDDKGDYFLMGDQSNTNDSQTNYSVFWTPEDNHGTRGINALYLDGHLEWTPMRGGDHASSQEMARKVFGSLSSNRARFDFDQDSRASEIATVE